jgi:hypothetical protein
VTEDDTLYLGVPASRNTLGSVFRSFCGQMASTRLRASVPVHAGTCKVEGHCRSQCYAFTIKIRLDLITYTSHHHTIINLNPFADSLLLLPLAAAMSTGAKLPVELERLVFESAAQNRSIIPTLVLVAHRVRVWQALTPSHACPVIDKA